MKGSECLRLFFFSTELMHITFAWFASMHIKYIYTLLYHLCFMYKKKLWRKHVDVLIKVQNIYARLQQHQGKHLKIAQYWFRSPQTQVTVHLFWNANRKYIYDEIEDGFILRPNQNQLNQHFMISKHPLRIRFLHNWKHSACFYKQLKNLNWSNQMSIFRLESKARLDLANVR